MFGIGSTEVLILAALFAMLVLPKVARARRATQFDYRLEKTKPRFKLNDVFASTGLIALGIAWILAAQPDLAHSIDPLELPMLLFIVGGAFIGAGVLAPFKIALVGAGLGAAVHLLLVWSAATHGWPDF
jgi:hypothetical protein